MTFSTVLEILALVAFILAVVGWKYRKTEPLAVGLALWSLAELLGRLPSSVTVSTLILILAFLAFVVAVIGWSYKRLNLIAVGLALWMLSLVIGPVLHIG